MSKNIFGFSNYDIDLVGHTFFLKRYLIAGLFIMSIFSGVNHTPNLGTSSYSF